MNRVIISSISDAIIAAMGENLVSLYSYGSALTPHFNKLSDFDFLVILNDASEPTLAVLHALVQHYADEDIRVDINVQTESEMPSHRNNAFWHNNRSIYVQSEILLYGELLYGKEQFKLYEHFDSSEIKLEASRIINSLVYQTRKMFINRSTTQEERYRIMKFCIYAATYALAAKGVYPKHSEDVFDNFHKTFVDTQLPDYLLSAPELRPKIISDAALSEAYDFLQHIDNVIYDIYSKQDVT